MKSFKVAEDVVPLGEFKANAPFILRLLSEQQRPLLITKNGQAAGVLLAPAQYDAFCEMNDFLDNIAKNFTETGAEQAMSEDQLRNQLVEYRQGR
jgi:PHD/YefM family antitoxin component YafN of YafNO toxin-antitoxin module